MAVGDDGFSSINQISQSDRPEVDQDYQVQCGDHEHYNIVVVDQIIPLPIEKVFEFVFTNHAFYRNWQQLRKSNNLEVGEWSEVDEKGERTRTVNYRPTIVATVGPKSCHTMEKQTIRAESRPGLSYLLDSDASSSGPMYSDHFYCQNRFCLNRQTATSTQLKLTSRIVYVKKVWGILKGIIDRSIKHQTGDSFVHMCQLLKEQAELEPLTEVSNTSSPHVSIQKKRKRTIKKRSSDDSTTNTSEPAQTQDETNFREKEPMTDVSLRDRKQTTHRQMSHDSLHSGGVTSQEEKETHVLKINIDVLVQIVFMLILVLAGINAMLYYKLITVEKQAQLVRNSRSHIVNDGASSIPNWDQVTKEELFNHDLVQWKEILSASTAMMEQLQRHFIQLAQELEKGRQNRYSFHEPQTENAEMPMTT